MSAQPFAAIAPELERHGISVDSATARRIERYAALLEHWNRRINLIGARDAATLWQRHILDCLMLETVPRPASLHTWLDVGSGGGLPGLLLALLHPDDRVTAVESVAKKATFLQEAARQLALGNFTCIHGDVWRLAEAPGFTPSDALVARAFSSLADLLALGCALVRPGGSVWAMKGRRWEAELEAVPPSIRARYEPIPGIHAYRLAPARPAVRSATAPREGDGWVLVFQRLAAVATEA